MGEAVSVGVTDVQAVPAVEAVEAPRGGTPSMSMDVESL